MRSASGAWRASRFAIALVVMIVLIVDMPIEWFESWKAAPVLALVVMRRLRSRHRDESELRGYFARETAEPLGPSSAEAA